MISNGDKGADTVNIVLVCCLHLEFQSEVSENEDVNFFHEVRIFKSLWMLKDPWFKVNFMSFNLCCQSTMGVGRGVRQVLVNNEQIAAAAVIVVVVIAAEARVEIAKVIIKAAAVAAAAASTATEYLTTCKRILQSQAALH